MNYIDKYGLYSWKPILEGGEPSENDGWILTAYAKKRGDTLQWDKLNDCFKTLKKSSEGYPVERLPNKETPYLSRDVVLGLSYLGLWNYGMTFSPFPLPKFNLFKLIHQLWKLKGKHRNHFWQNEGFEQVYHTAFMVPFQDRAFVLRCQNKKVPMIYRVIEWVDSRKKATDKSSAYIRWLKYNHKIIEKNWK